MKKSSNISHKRSTRGFSLVEILTSLIVISVGSIGVGKLYTTMLHGTSESKNRFEAATLVEAQLETLRFAFMTGDNNTAQSGTDTIVKDNITYVRNWTFSNVNKGQTNITAEVKWKNKNGEYTNETIVKLATVASDYQPSVSLALAETAAPPPVFQAAGATEKCNTLALNGAGWTGTTYGDYGSGASGYSPTSCGSGVNAYGATGSS